MSDLLYGIFGKLHLLHAYAFTYTAQLSKEGLGERRGTQSSGTSLLVIAVLHVMIGMYVWADVDQEYRTLPLLPEYPSQCTFPIAWDSPGAWQVPGGHVGFLGCPSHRRDKPGEGTAGGACHLNYRGSLSGVVETSRVSSEHLSNCWAQAFTMRGSPCAF